MQTHIEEIRELGGEVLAISADPPEDSRAIVARYGFAFPLLSDPDLKVIDAYGLRHPDGGLEGDIARPAVFILDRDGRIVWRDLTDNWRVRVRPEALLEALRAIP